MKLHAEEVATQLFDNLWEEYSEKVHYAAIYSKLLQQKGAKPVVDHLVLRTLNTHTGEQPGGVEAISHLLVCFGYQFVEKYLCTDKQVTVQVFEHPGGRLPAVLVSQLEVNHLPGWMQHTVAEIVGETAYNISDSGIELLNILKTTGVLPIEAARFLIADLRGYFCRPWGIPALATIERIAGISPYCAWVLLYGNTVCRFSVNVNLQGVNEWSNLGETTAALYLAGVPLQKTAIAESAKINQSFTPVVKVKTEVWGDEGLEFIMFDYSKFGLTERSFESKNRENKHFKGFVFGEAGHFFDLV